MELDSLQNAKYFKNHENTTKHSSFICSSAVIGAGAMLWLNYDDLFNTNSNKAEFTDLEFDADDTSYSPAETHSMNQLSKELAALKERLLEREKELDARESAIVMDMESLENQRKN